MQDAAFQATIWHYYAQHGRRDLPWRQPQIDGSYDPYRIVVSEIMLQQTQVSRVIPKFEQFMATFPTFAALAAAPLAEVLKAWSGLGYNRRTKFLWQTARQVMADYGGQLPDNLVALSKLSGIGPNTAGAILAYAYNKPVVFVETNIRTVFIHHFFSDTAGKVRDQAIVDLVVRTLSDNPRQWYWALMDYGTHLKQTVGNVSRQSAHYTKQSAFEGSRRQVRGKVLALLGDGAKTYTVLQQAIKDRRLDAVLTTLEAERLISRRAAYYTLHGA